MIVLTEAEVAAGMSLQLAFDAVTQALIAAADGSGSVNPVLMANGLNQGEVYGVKSGAARTDPLVGLKVGSYWPGNAAAGIPCHGSSILLLDPRTGRLTTVVEASGLNGPRTAAANAVAARVLSREESSTLTVIGAGHQAIHEVRALCAIRPITTVLIASRNTARASALRDSLASELDATIELTAVERGCRAADIVTTVTTSRAPLLESNWLKKGVHVASMGSDQVGKQELPPDLLRSARCFCDLPSQSVLIGEMQHVRDDVESGVVQLTAIGDVLRGVVPGRLSSHEMTVFDSSGLALQDLFVADHLIRSRALRDRS